MKSMLERLGKPTNVNIREFADQAHPKNTEGDQRDERDGPSTSSYESLNSTNDDTLRLPYLIRKSVTQLTQELRESALTPLPI